MSINPSLYESYYLDPMRYDYGYIRHPDYRPLTLELVGQYLATKGEDEPIGTMRDRKGCLLAMTLNHFYPDSTGMTYWIVGGVNYGKERFGGVPTSIPCPLTPELRHLVGIFDGISGHTVTKAQFRANLHAIGRTDYLRSLFSPQKTERTSREEEEAYYRAKMQMLRWYDTCPSIYTQPDPSTWMVNPFAEPEPITALTSIASALDGVDLGWMEITGETEKEKGETQVEEKELVLV